jgi:phosphoglycolate phosphatase
MTVPVPRARAVVLDLDGTLIDSRLDIAASANAARAALGLPALDPATIVGFVGDGADKLIERLTPGAGSAERERALAAFKAHYAVHCCVATKPYAGIPAALAALRADGWRLAVATNKPEAFARAILRGLALMPLFDAVRGGDRVRKPDPAPVRELLVELGADPAASWMVGDHHTDIRAGRGAGCRVLWCGWGFGDRDGLAVDAEIAAPAELPGALGTAWR